MASKYGTTSEFSLDISKFVKKAEDRLDAFMLEFTQQIAKAVVEGSPVDTGHFRRSWNANIGSPILTDPGLNIEKTKYGESSATTTAMTQIVTSLLGVKGGDIVYITNNVKYGPMIEFEGWSSTKAPNGVVQPVISRVDNIATAALAKVKAKIK